ncbi:MAG: hypothetical protein SWO11_12320 [Thermodesulfobacteriota bacterium]|nr:hypothetical protein [Thermodesulfobacteriota bacterium]
MSYYTDPTYKTLKRKKISKPKEEACEVISINDARKKVGLPILISKDRKCIVCGESFRSNDASHRVCNKCRPKWERKRDDLEKAFIDIEDSDTFYIQEVDELSIFEDIE